MLMLKFVIVIVYFWAFSSCCVYPFRPYITDINNIGIPKKDPFSISRQPFTFSNSSAIDTTSIYIVEAFDRWYGAKYLDTFYYYYVFFSNGAFFKSSIFEDHPLTDQINQYKNGFIGEYRYLNDSSIITQVYYPIECGYVYTSLGTITDDKIIMNQGSSSSMLNKYEHINITLNKTKVENLGLKPYWIEYKLKNK